MIVASHQPNFLPYMGFFYKAAKCDVLVFSDDVQFSKKGMHNWNRIKTPSGEAKLTLPVHAHHDMRLADSAGWLSLASGGAALTPETGKIYVILSEGDYINKTYRWSGSTYVQTNPVDISIITNEEIDEVAAT